MMTLGADLAPAEGTGEFLGLWRITGDFGGASGPVLVGNIADIFGLSISAFALGGNRISCSQYLSLVSTRNTAEGMKCRERDSNPYARYAH